MDTKDTKDGKDAKDAMYKLGDEQQLVLDAIEGGHNVFIGGGAGTGKSFLIKRIVSSLPEKTTFVTASTGLAAVNVGGVTIHSFAGVGFGQDKVESLISTIRKKKVYRDRWQNATTLIVDEISMISADLWDKLEEIARTIRGNQKPFGGIQIIASGDFLQLPPVVKDKKDIPFCFLAKSWAKCMTKQILLTQIYRQSDQAFITLLEELRYGKPSPESIKQLQSIHQSSKKQSDVHKGNEGKDGKDGLRVEATRLYATRADVDKENQKRLNALKEDAHAFLAKNKGKPGAMDSCSAVNKLVLKKGAQVVLLKNLDQEKGLVNGSRGVVLNIQKSLKHVGLYAPYVRFSNGQTLLVERERWDMKSGESIVGSRKQIPLALAWAMTIHKAQGLTIDMAQISLAECFEYGHAYVAMSRMRSLDGLTLLSFDASKIKAHPKVIDYYQKLSKAIVAESKSSLARRDEKKSAPDDGYFGEKTAAAGGAVLSMYVPSAKRALPTNAFTGSPILKRSKEDDEFERDMAIFDETF